MNLDIVIVTYRSADRIRACLDALPVDAGVHTFVIDNASGDGAAEIARRQGACVVENRDNRGFGAGANQGAALGQAELILFLNPDALVRPGSVEAMVARMADPHVAIVGASLVQADGTPQRSRWPYPSASRMWLEAAGLDRVMQRDGSGFVVGACFLVRRSVLEALKGFDERFWLYGEEADLCFRAEQAGWRVDLAEEAVVEHVGGASGRESTELVDEHFTRGSDLFVYLHRGKQALVSYRLAGLVASAVRWPLLRVLRPDDPRTRTRGRHLRRMSWSLLRHPMRVADPVQLPTIGPQLVVLSLEPWDDVWRRNQFLVRELLELEPALRVLWVEPPHDILHETARTRRLPRLQRKSPRPLPGQPRILLMRPRKWLPRAVWPRVDGALSAQVRRAINRLGFDRPLLWANDSAYLPLVRSCDTRAVYDITDDWLDSSMSARQRRRLGKREIAMMNVVDDVVVCSAELARRRSTIRPVHLVPNAVDTAHLQAPRGRPADLPSGRVAVYVGSLHDDRIDAQLVATIAARLPELSIVLVGPNYLSSATNRLLADVSNVYLLGARPYADVPGYLQHADVVIVPHAVSSFTESLDPIKAYECLAVGRPTLATPVAGFRGLLPPIHICGPEAFAERLAELLDDGATTTPVAVPTWRERADQFWKILSGDDELPASERRFRVAYVGHTALASGGELALARLLPGLAHVDATVILATDGPMVQQFEAAGARVEVLPMPEAARAVKRDAVTPSRLPIVAGISTVRYTIRLARRLRVLRPDVVHTNTLKAAIYGGVAGRLAGIPVIWHVRDRIAPDYLPKAAVLAVRLLARVVPDAIITNSIATRDTLGAVSKAIGVAPRPVVYDPVAGIPTVAAADADGEVVVGIVGRLAPWKGQDVFLRAFAAAFPDGGARAIVVGGPLFGELEFETMLKQLAVELRVDGRIEFAGHVDDVSSYLERMHVVVHASVIPEPFGQVVVEAMAAGRPTIASAAGGPLEIVCHGVDGILVTPSDVDELASAMRRLVDDPELGRRLGAAALVSVERFRPEKIGPIVERLYRRVAAPSHG